MVPDTELRRFLLAYAKAATDGDVDHIAASYAPTYVESSPAGTAAWTVDDDYRVALRQRTAMMRDQLGFQAAGVDLLSVREIAPHHYLLDARWSMRFAPKGRNPVTSEFTITYLVRGAANPKILAYVSHEDEAALMRRDGIID